MNVEQLVLDTVNAIKSHRSANGCTDENMMHAYHIGVETLLSSFITNSIEENKKVFQGLIEIVDMQITNNKYVAALFLHQLLKTLQNCEVYKTELELVDDEISGILNKTTKKSDVFIETLWQILVMRPEKHLNVVRDYEYERGKKNVSYEQFEFGILHLAIYCIAN
jgi:hypothetical protein